MIIKPRVRGFMCITSHPVGCENNVVEQINYIKRQEPIEGPKRVLVIGSSTGYGLSARITAAFGCGAATLGVFFEKPGMSASLGLLVGITVRHSISMLMPAVSMLRVSTVMLSPTR